jgi:hypothetical protein
MSAHFLPAAGAATIALTTAMGVLCVSEPAFAGSDEIAADAKNAGLWPAPARDFSPTRHSPLNDINAGNIDKPQMIGSQATRALRGHEGQPIVVQVVSAWPNIVQPLDLPTPDYPAQVWRPTLAHDYWANGKALPEWVKNACCGPADAHHLRPDQVHRSENYYYVDGYSSRIPAGKALPSEDGDYWIFYTDAGLQCDPVIGDGASQKCRLVDQQSDVYCFFVPMDF